MDTLITHDDGPRRTRRHLTILFADLSGYTAISSEVDPELSLNLLQNLKRLCERVITRHGGFVHGSKGDGVMGVFGFPESTEFAGRRAVEAALDLREAMRDLPSDLTGVESASLRLHTGVHSGLATFEADDVTIIGGEAPNLAARLSDLALADEILVSAATLSGESRYFDIEDRGTYRLRGKEQPIAVLQVVGRLVAGARFEVRRQQRLTPFVGRTAELARLDAILQRVLAGDRAEVALVAGPGLGKTRLVDEFLRGAARLPVRVCRGYCESYLGAEPLQPFLQMLRQLAKDESGGASMMPELQRALSLQVVSSERAVHVAPSGEAADICAHVFVALAQRQPLVMVVDDWQWADDASKQLLSVLRRGAAPSTLILIASRSLPPGNGVDEDAEVLPLPPFTPEETAQAILTLSPDAHPFQVEDVERRSGGNPLYIEELCHWSKAPVGSDADRDEALPTWLSTLIESRVSRLPAQEASVVRAAAIIGTNFPAWLLEQVVDDPAVAALIPHLAERDLIFPGEVAETLRFKHGITRDVVYASVGLRERQELHRKVARCLEQRHLASPQETFLEVLSYHFRAGSLAEKTAHYAELAGDRALAAAAPDRARRQYLSALAALDLLDPSDAVYRRWSAIVHRLGLACVFDPSRSHLTTFARAADRARSRNDRPALARAEYWLGFVHYALGENVDALEHYARAREYCTQSLDDAMSRGDTSAVKELGALNVQLLATIGQARAAAGEHDGAIQMFDQALAIKRHHRRHSTPAVGSAYTLACKGAVLGDLGRFAEAQLCFDEAIDAIRSAQSPVESSILGWRSAVYLWQGRWSDAREAASRARTLAQRAGSVYVLAQGQAVAGYATWMLAGTLEGLVAMERATAWLERLDKRLSISINYGYLAEAFAEIGRWTEARQYSQRALARAALRDPFGEACAYRALARDTWTEPDGRADTLLDQAMRAARARGSTREEALTLVARGQRAAHGGRSDEAIMLIDDAQAMFTSMEMEWHAAQARHHPVRPPAR